MYYNGGSWSSNINMGTPPVLGTVGGGSNSSRNTASNDSGSRQPATPTTAPAKTTAAQTPKPAAQTPAPAPSLPHESGGAKLFKTVASVQAAGAYGFISMFTPAPVSSGRGSNSSSRFR